MKYGNPLLSYSGDFVTQIHKRNEYGVLTLSFAEQANSFAIGEYFYTSVTSEEKNVRALAK